MEPVSIFSELLNRITDSISSLPDNEIFIGLIFTGLVSSIVYLGRKIPKKIFDVLRNNLTIQMTFKEDTVDYVLKYMNSLPTLIGPKSINVRLDSSDIEQALGEGFHIKKYKNILIKTNIDIKYSENTGMQYTVLLLTLFTRNNKYKENFLNDIYRNNFNDGVKVLVNDGYYWRLHTTLEYLDENSLFFNDNLMEKIVKDLEQWKGSKDEYQRLGILYKRGYLLYGKPGTGKSSILNILAQKLNEQIYYLDPSSINSGNSQLIELISQVKKNSMLVIEDIDSSFGLKIEKREAKKQKEEDNIRITLSGILNVFSGIIACSGFITIFTTNYPENIDEALLRSGRVDRSFEFDLLDSKTLKRMSKFYGVKLDDTEISNLVPISPADAQQKFIKMKNNKSNLIPLFQDNETKRELTNENNRSTG